MSSKNAKGTRHSREKPATTTAQKHGSRTVTCLPSGGIDGVQSTAYYEREAPRVSSHAARTTRSTTREAVPAFLVESCQTRVARNRTICRTAKRINRVGRHPRAHTRVRVHFQTCPFLWAAASWWLRFFEQGGDEERGGTEGAKTCLNSLNHMIGSLLAPFLRIITFEIVIRCWIQRTGYEWNNRIIENSYCRQLLKFCPILRQLQF